MATRQQPKYVADLLNRKDEFCLKILNFQFILHATAMTHFNSLTPESRNAA
jgi:hypothetical protein